MTSETPHEEIIPETAPPSAESVSPTAEATPAADATGNETLTAQLETLRQQVEANLDGWQRSRAEFVNYKKRAEREMKEARERGAHDAITTMLPIMDDFERALQNIPEDLKTHPWVSGTSLILKKFDKVLEAHNVTIIDPVGQPFNPHQHEAIGTDSNTEHPNGHVTVTLQKGYLSGERVLRPALVRIAG